MSLGNSQRGYGMEGVGGHPGGPEDFPGCLSPLQGRQNYSRFSAASSGSAAAISPGDNNSYNAQQQFQQTQQQPGIDKIPLSPVMYIPPYSQAEAAQKPYHPVQVRLITLAGILCAILRPHSTFFGYYWNDKLSIFKASLL